MNLLRVLLAAGDQMTPFEAIERLIGEGSIKFDVGQAREFPVHNVELEYGPDLDVKITLMGKIYMVSLTPNPRVRLPQLCNRRLPIRRIEVEEHAVYARTALNIRYRVWAEQAMSGGDSGYILMAEEVP